MKHLFTAKSMVLYLLLFMSGGALFAQGITTASIRGEVEDEQGNPLIGANVVATHLPTGTTYGTATNIDGRYTIPNVRVGGPYRVEVTYTGFGGLSETDVFLGLGEVYRRDFELREEAVQIEGVVVTAIRGEGTGTETNIDERAIQNLPTVGRNLTDFTRLTPQANIISTGDGAAISLAGQNNRFNSFFIDGAISNDVFGLAGSGTNGGQTGLGPISIDAIEEFQVAVSPFDVKYGGFTGGAINAVTRSGSNNFEGSVYWFNRNESLAGKTPDTDEDDRVRLPDFNSNTYGFRLGGPIVKNKLFFFVNGEIQRDDQPQPFDIANYQGDFSADELDGIRSFFQETYNYDPGDWRNNIREQNSDRFLVRLDWNASEKHKFTLRHSFTFNEEFERSGSSPRSINFENNAEYFPSETNSTALEWNALFSDRISNNLILGYTSVRDDRGPTPDGGRFPYLLIDDGPATLRIGTERFSTANILNQDVFTLTNNFNLFLGDHTVTIGTHNEYYDIFNLFIRENFGVYEYTSFDEFAQGAAPINYRRSYALRPTVDAAVGDDAAEAAADFRGLQLGFYLQDDWQITSRFSLKYGLRLDVPFFLDNPPVDEYFNNEAKPEIAKFYPIINETESGEMPSGQLHWSPRLGFNYDVFGNRRFVLRGGAGIFTSRIPYVWPGGAFTNSGVLVGGVFQDDEDGVTLPDGAPLEFRPDPNNQYVGEDFNAPAAVPSGQLDLFTRDFKFPQIFRTSLGADFQLPGGFRGSVEGIYSKNVNNVVYYNTLLNPPTAYAGQQPDGTITGFDNRPVWDNGTIDNTYVRVIVGDNTSKGWSTNFTAKLEKEWSRNVYTSVSYTFGRSKVLNDGTSSQNSSQWRFTESVYGKNDLELGFSDFDVGHRVVGFVAFRKEYFNFGATGLSLFYEGRQGFPFSYVYDNSMVQDDGFRSDNDLIYVPRSAAEINLVPANGKSPAEQWAEIDRFIRENPYLNENRGNYVTRNGARQPWEHVVDLKFTQDFFVNVGGKRHNLQFTFDIFNFTNLLNNKWGLRYDALGFNNAQFLRFEGYADPDNGDYTPTFSSLVPSDNNPVRVTRESSNLSRASRWIGQIGLRYTFN